MARMPTTEANDRRLTYSPAEAAALLGIGRPLIYKALGAGELRALKIGARTVITREALDDFVKGLPAFGPERR